MKQAQIIIGLPGYRSHGEVTLGKMLALPFRRQRPAHLLPDGREPIRTAVPLHGSAPWSQVVTKIG